MEHRVDPHDLVLRTPPLDGFTPTNRSYARLARRMGPVSITSRRRNGLLTSARSDNRMHLAFALDRREPFVSA